MTLHGHRKNIDPQLLKGLEPHVFREPPPQAGRKAKKYTCRWCTGLQAKARFASHLRNCPVDEQQWRKLPFFCYIFMIYWFIKGLLQRLVLQVRRYRRLWRPSMAPLSPQPPFNQQQGLQTRVQRRLQNLTPQGAWVSFKFIIHFIFVNIILYFQEKYSRYCAPPGTLFSPLSR